MRHLLLAASSADLSIDNDDCSTVHPFFVKTNIFGLIPTLLLTGIPLPTVDDVVAAMTAAACKTSSNGSAFVVDFKCVPLFPIWDEKVELTLIAPRRGILEIPFSASASEENGGYYAIFAQRAQGALSYVSPRVSLLFRLI